jgi:hypothetical protein
MDTIPQMTPIQAVTLYFDYETEAGICTLMFPSVYEFHREADGRYWLKYEGGQKAIVEPGYVAKRQGPNEAWV